LFCFGAICVLNYDGLSKKPLILKSFSGLEVIEFNALNSKIKEKYDAFEQKRLSREDQKKGSVLI
jgi:hypothetical protein